MSTYDQGTHDSVANGTGSILEDIPITETTEAEHHQWFSNCGAKASQVGRKSSDNVIKYSDQAQPLALRPSPFAMAVRDCSLSASVCAADQVHPLIPDGGLDQTYTLTLEIHQPFIQSTTTTTTTIKSKRQRLRQDFIITYLKRNKTTWLDLGLYRSPFSYDSKII
ncbi:hypothetical protein EYF80_021056 [Liparis tanakae]|uniref:Uncharacterized protein n=1 Tax=Liparis tanakae TaxID=230148 RepID=A0A4Z2HUQ1_9TELE|nr:hypothetical protein EYF80_021056 [Liparis tanakae]